MAQSSFFFLALTTLMLGCGESDTPETPSPEPEAAPAPAEPAEAAPAEAEPAEAEPAEAEPVVAEDCCCHHSDAAGAGLTRFSREQGTCDGSIYMTGCVEPSVCDVASLPSKPMAELGKLRFTPSAGAPVTITGSAAHLFNHGEGESRVQVIYYPHPASEVMAKWTEEITSQGFTLIEGDFPGESHGPVVGFERGDDAIIGEFEEGCQGSSGTCVWNIATMATADK